MNIAETPIPVAEFQPRGGAGLPAGALPRSYPRGVRLGLHVHREAQLLFAASGIMLVTTPKGRWLVPPERAVWLPPGIEHAVDVLADIEMRALLVAPDRLAGHPEAPRLAREFVVAVGPLLRQAILAAFKPDGHQRRAVLLTDLALFELAEAEDAATFMPMPADPRARRAADLVLADPASERALDDLARAAGTSMRTITRLFPAETGLTFKEWRQRARIMAAVAALSGGIAPGDRMGSGDKTGSGDGTGSIKQVAGRLGFSSVAAFGHAFRQIMHLTPSEFLRSAGGRRT